MSRDIEDAGILLENGLCAITVVDIEVHDGHTRQTMFPLGGPGGDGGIAENAKTHCLVHGCMMAGGSQECKAIPQFTAGDRKRQIDQAPRGNGCCFLRVRCDVGIGVKICVSGVTAVSDNTGSA